MTINLSQIPDSFMPVGNELVICARSNQESQPLFRYKVRVYQDATVIQTLLYPPRPETGLKFDPARILQNYVSFDIEQITGYDNTSGFPNDATVNVFIDYKVDIIEQYGTDQQTYASALVSNVIGINASLQWQQWLNLTIADYLNQNGAISNFLTNSPRRLRVGFNERAMLGFMANEDPATIFPVPWSFMDVRAYDESGNLISFPTIVNTLTGAGPANQFQTLFISPVDLNVAFFTQTGTVAIPANTAYYELWLADDFGERTTEVFTIVIDDLCTRYQTFRLHFLNRWGRIDSFTLMGDTDFLTGATENISTRAPGYANNQTWLYAANRHSMVNFNTPYENKYMLKAAFVTVDEKEWLEELMTSPAVWWQAGANDDATQMWAVNITRVSDYKKEQHGLFTALFEMKLSTGSNTQNR
jgi:hypothetical protein